MDVREENRTIDVPANGIVANDAVLVHVVSSEKQRSIAVYMLPVDVDYVFEPTVTLPPANEELVRTSVVDDVDDDEKGS